jgi:Niemann-Pick C2 protein
LFLDQEYSLGKIRIHGVIANLPVPFPVRPDNACNNWGMECPLKEGSEHSLNLQMPIRRAYPRIPLIVQMKLVSEKSTTLFCTQFPARIMRAEDATTTTEPSELSP